MIHYQSLCPYVIILTIGLLMTSRLFYMIKMSCIKSYMNTVHDSGLLITLSRISITR